VGGWKKCFIISQYRQRLTIVGFPQAAGASVRGWRNTTGAKCSIACDRLCNFQRVSNPSPASFLQQADDSLEPSSMRLPQPLGRSARSINQDILNAGLTNLPVQVHPEVSSRIRYGYSHDSVHVASIQHFDEQVSNTIIHLHSARNRKLAFGYLRQ
jgi:hypothetical protein